MAGEGKHLTAQPHEFDAIFVIPAQDLNQISRIGQSQRLNVSLAAGNIRRPIPIRAVLGRMRRLRGIRKWVSVFKNGRDATGPRAEHWLVRVP